MCACQPPDRRNGTPLALISGLANWIPGTGTDQWGGRPPSTREREDRNQPRSGGQGRPPTDLIIKSTHVPQFSLWAQSAICYIGSHGYCTTDQVIEAARAENRSALSEIESKQLLESVGIPTTMPRRASSATKRRLIAKEIGFPVALKVLSPDVTHKSDVGGVVLGLTSGAQVEKAAFKEIKNSLASQAPSARFEGVAVQAMAKPGVEMLAGITSDQAFGPMLVVGLGGVLVEVFKDVVMRPAPIDAKTGREMVDELKGAALLRGVRGMPPADVDAFVRLLVKLGRTRLHARPDIREMDLNPVMLYPDGLMAVDARVALNDAAGSGRRARQRRSRGGAPQEPGAGDSAAHDRGHRRQAGRRLHLAARAIQL